MSEFKKNLSVFTKENFGTTGKLITVQKENDHWVEYCKRLVIASKAHEVVKNE